MPRVRSVVTLDKLLSTFSKQWREHHEALTKIEAVFAKYGIDPAKLQPAAPKAETADKATIAAPAGRKRRKRRQFAQTADEFILGLLSGNKSPTTAQINAAWIESGRANKADNTLTRMVKDKKLKREAVKNGRGSKYSRA